MRTRNIVFVTVMLCLVGPGLRVSAQVPEKGVQANMDVVRYEDFGAVGDGKADDFDAIVKAHAHANARKLPVRANDGATYYIGGADKTAIIETDTNWGKARFIIDDTDVKNRRANIFTVRSTLKPLTPKGITSLKSNQGRIEAALPGPCLISVTNSHVKHYIRYGANQNKGSAQTDVFLVDKDGKVDADGPIIWDFDRITEITARPIDPEPLSLTGGVFTTRANAAESRYTYYSRGLAIRRSNVVVDGVEHYVVGEGEQGAPYAGFINVALCADVTVRDCILTGHKTYRTIGSAGRPVSMGTYDINLGRAVNVSLINCRQSNDIKDGRYWGIMASNFCKNLLLDKCVFSRFDAHQGVTNAAIRNSTLGHAGINAIGHGTLLVEKSTVYGSRLINLRSDYGSTWRGDFVIRDCVFVPAGGRSVSASLIGGHNTGRHDFGYTCYMPETITIDGLRIDDRNHPKGYRGPAIFSNFNRGFTEASYQEKFPYVKTKKVILKDVTTASGKPLRLSDNPVMFKGVEVISR